MEQPTEKPTEADEHSAPPSCLGIAETISTDVAHTSDEATPSIQPFEDKAPAARKKTCIAFGSSKMGNAIALLTVLLALAAIIWAILTQRWTVRSSNLQNCAALAQVDVRDRFCNDTLASGVPAFFDWRRDLHAGGDLPMPSPQVSLRVIARLAASIVLTLALCISGYIYIRPRTLPSPPIISLVRSFPIYSGPWSGIKEYASDIFDRDLNLARRRLHLWPWSYGTRVREVDEGLESDSPEATSPLPGSTLSSRSVSSSDLPRVFLWRENDSLVEQDARTISTEESDDEECKDTAPPSVLTAGHGALPLHPTLQRYLDRKHTTQQLTADLEKTPTSDCHLLLQKRIQLDYAASLLHQAEVDCIDEGLEQYIETKGDISPSNEPDILQLFFDKKTDLQILEQKLAAIQAERHEAHVARLTSMLQGRDASVEEEDVEEEEQQWNYARELEEHIREHTLPKQNGVLMLESR